MVFETGCELVKNVLDEDEIENLEDVEGELLEGEGDDEGLVYVVKGLLDVVEAELMVDGAGGVLVLFALLLDDGEWMMGVEELLLKNFDDVEVVTTVDGVKGEVVVLCRLEIDDEDGLDRDDFFELGDVPCDLYVVLVTVDILLVGAVPELW